MISSDSQLLFRFFLLTLRKYTKSTMASESPSSPVSYHIHTIFFFVCLPVGLAGLAEKWEELEWIASTHEENYD